MPIFVNPALGTHPGKRQTKINQDAVAYHYPEEATALSYFGVVFAITDGVGSVPNSEYASRLILHRLLEGYYRQDISGTPSERIKRIIGQVNRELFKNSSMGAATLSVLVVIDDQYILAHVGDSPVYLIEDQNIQQLTTPHITRRRDGGTRLSRAVGHRAEVDVDIQQGSLKTEQRLIMLSDGISRYYDANAIRKHTRRLPPPLAVEALISGANQRGGVDNMSVIVLDFGRVTDYADIARNARLLEPVVMWNREALSPMTIPAAGVALSDVITLTDHDPRITSDALRRTTGSLIRVVTRRQVEADEPAPLLMALLVFLAVVVLSVILYIVAGILNYI